MYCSPFADEGDRAGDGRGLHGHFPELLAVSRAEDREGLPGGAFDHEIAGRRQHAAVAVARQGHAPRFLLRDGIPRHEPRFLFAVACF